MFYKATEKTLAGKGPGLYLFGEYVTERVHEAFSKIMRANQLGDPAYEARVKCNAFFQGGSDNPKGKFVFIEFFQPELKNHEDFMAVVNNEVMKVTPTAATEIMVWPDIAGAYGYVVMISEDTGCSYNAGDSRSPITFKPENSAQYREVYELCLHVGLNVVNDPMKK